MPIVRGIPVKCTHQWFSFGCEVEAKLRAHTDTHMGQQYPRDTGLSHNFSEQPHQDAKDYV